MEDGNGSKIGNWLSKFDENTAYCNSCKKTINISYTGKNALLKHSISKTHQQSVNLLSEEIENPSITDNQHANENQEQDYTLDENICKAEILWSIATAEHDIPFATNDHATKLFPKMFPDSAIASGFKCCRTKTTYIVKDGIAVANLEKLKEKLKDKTFSILIDESNKNYGEKYFCIMVKYYDEELKVIQIKFLDLKKCNKSNADNLTRVVVECFEEHNLKWDNLIQIMSDSCSIMRGIHKGVVSQLKNKYAKHVIDIGGCSLHHVSNACEHGLKELFRYEALESFVQDASSFFSFHVEYAEKLQDLQKALDINEHKILKYCSVRFLSIYPVVNRILEQFQALEKMFIEDIPKYDPKIKQQHRFQRITEAIKCKYTLPTLYFIQFSLEIYQKYEKLFQRDSPTIHIMYSKQVDLFRNTLLQFCRFELIENIKNDKDLITFDFKDKKHVLPIEKINIGIKARGSISRFTNTEKNVFLEGVKQYYIKLSEQLLKNLSLSNSFLANLEFLNPISRTIESEKKVLSCAQKLPPGANIGHKEIDALSTEWKNLVLENIPKNWYTDEVQKYKPLDYYWSKVFDIKDCNNEVKYPVLSKVVKSCFSIAEANANVERLFSQITHILQKERKCLNLDTVKGILYSKEVCLDVEIDDQLMFNAKVARSRYTAQLSLQQPIMI